MQPYIVYDLETRKTSDEVGGWENIFEMELSMGVTWSSWDNQYRFWTDETKQDLCQFMNGHVTVTYNGISFDSRLLLGNHRRVLIDGTTENEQWSWQNIDIYAEIWRRILGLPKDNYQTIMQEMRKQRPPKGVLNLDGVTKTTLQTHKSGSGGFAPTLYKEGRMLELIGYTLHDVRVTKELFLFIKKHKYIITGNHDVVSFQ